MEPGSIQPESSRKLSGLDPDSLMNILRFLDVESLLQFQIAFPQLLSVSRSPDLWLEQLLRVWHLPLQVVEGQHPNLQHLYRAIATVQRQLLRFRAAWTNGGEDEDLPSYSMDNMLDPTPLNGHCTVLGQNVTVIGFLLGPGTHAAQTQRMSAFVQHTQRMRLHENGIPKLALDSEHVLLDAHVWQATQQPATLSTLGIIDSVSVRRQGSFSCPVRAGVFALGQQVSAREDTSGALDFQAGTDSLTALSQQPGLQAFNDITQLKDVMRLSSRGVLPRIVQIHVWLCGCYVEFDPRGSAPHQQKGCMQPSAAQQGHTQPQTSEATEPAAMPCPAAAPASSNSKTLPVLRPLVWFKFFTEAEAEAYEEARKGAHLPGSMRPPVCCALEAELVNQEDPEICSEELLDLVLEHWDCLTGTNQEMWRALKRDHIRRVQQRQRLGGADSFDFGLLAELHLGAALLQCLAEIELQKAKLPATRRELVIETVSEHFEASLTWVSYAFSALKIVEQGQITQCARDVADFLRNRASHGEYTGSSGEFIESAHDDFEAPKDAFIFQISLLHHNITDDGDRRLINMLLREQHTGNVLAVKLINQENLMHEDYYDHELPNIDVNYVALGGRLVQLPAGVKLTPE